MGAKRSADERSRDPVVSIPVASVTCAVCQQIMHDPATLECACRRSFCRECITAWQKKRGTCPLCNTKVDRCAPLCPGPTEWGEALDSIKRPCPNNPTCRFRRGSYAEARDHAVNECAFRTVTCPNEACDEVLEHRQLRDHLRLCLLRRCKNFRAPRYGCGVMGTIEFVKQHESKCFFSEPEVLKQIEELAASKRARERTTTAST